MNKVNIETINIRSEWLASKNLLQGVDRCDKCKVTCNGFSGVPDNVIWEQCVYGKEHAGFHSYEDNANIKHDAKMIKEARESLLDL